MADDELRAILTRLPNRHALVVMMAQHRDDDTKAGRPTADLWGYLAAELAEVEAVEARRWREFTHEHPVPWPKAEP